MHNYGILYVATGAQSFGHYKQCFSSQSASAASPHGQRPSLVVHQVEDPVDVRQGIISLLEDTAVIPC
jgi:hypothetical protein